MPNKSPSQRNAAKAPHRPANPTPPKGYPTLADIERVRERLNLAAVCRDAGVSYGAVKSCIQYQREPSADVYIPLAKALRRLSTDLGRAVGKAEQ